jgi:signal peptidase I
VSGRPIPARIGIVALNLLAPGAGLLRLGRPRAALAFLAAVPALLILIVAVYAIAPTFGFAAYATAMLLLLVTFAGSLIGSAIMSWRASAEPAATGSWWARWYGITGAVVASIVLGSLLVEAAHGFYKPFYVPSEAMAPTLLPNDRMVASMRPPAELRRGEIILLQVSDSIYVKRIAGLPGDRIGLVGGKVFLNGSPVEQKLEGMDPVEWPAGHMARRLSERFPGEQGPHLIHDSGPGPVDDFPETLVPPGHLFVLGDNRDMSADSRVPPAESGVGLLPVERIRGVPLFHDYGSSKDMGEPIRR